MDDDDDQGGGVMDAVRNKTGVIVGVIGLCVWFAMLWFMFGDVL